MRAFVTCDMRPIWDAKQTRYRGRKTTESELLVFARNTEEAIEKLVKMDVWFCQGIAQKGRRKRCRTYAYPYSKEEEA